MGENAVQVGGISDRSGEPRDPSLRVVDSEVVAEVAKDLFSRTATDDDLVGSRLVHGLSVTSNGVSPHHSKWDLTRVRPRVRGIT